MRHDVIFLLSLCFLLGASPMLQAQKLEGSSLEIRFSDQTKRIDKEKINNAKYGKGEIEKFENKYDADLKNSDYSNALSNITLRMVSFYMPYDFDSKDSGHEPNKVQVQEKISLAPGEEKTVDFKTETFETGESQLVSRGGTTTLVTTYHLGVEYAGVVLEIYQDNRLIGTRYDGNSKLRKAYEKWLEKNGLHKGTAEAEKPAAVEPPPEATAITP